MIFQRRRKKYFRASLSLEQGLDERKIRLEEGWVDKQESNVCQS